MIQTAKALLEIARPKQWVKNAFVFAPLIFAQKATAWESTGKAMLAFALFCAFSSCVYMLNDMVDLERDRLHPEKKKRPLPSGRLSVSTVLFTSLILFTATVLIAYWLTPSFLAVGLAYILINFIYSFWLRSMVILDGMFIAAGFVLRIVAGAWAIDVNISDWLYVCATFVSLFLAFCKRRHEILLLGEDSASAHRSNLREYSTELLDMIITVVTSATLVTYALYCIDENNPIHSDSMIYTIPFVIYGLFRYLYLVHRKEEGGNPTELLLSDRPLIINGLLWLGIIFWVLYFP